MQKVELLAPAGDIETLRVAILAGADAVYIAGKNFGARQFAPNFTDEELAEAVIYAHQRKAKVYVTVNTIVYESEFLMVQSYINYLYKIKVDALIIQDLGLLYYVRSNFPDFEVHASTQMNIFNEAGLKLLKALGVKRVVLAREVSLDEISKFTDQGIEIETFVHGAICFCASGNCLLSYSIGKRSGNRGMCAQPCRKKYTLFENNRALTKKESLMSMKDLLTIDNIDELIDAKITSFKIEGRMKSKEYVYVAVRSYRLAIDAYYKGLAFDTIDAKKQMALTFNRTFTKGYIKNDTNDNLTNWHDVNHQGTLIGKVVGQKKDYIEILLTDNLMVGDAIRIKAKDEVGFYVQKMYLDQNAIKKAYQGMKIAIFIKLPPVINHLVYLTKSYAISDEVKNYVREEHIKIPLYGVLTLKLNQKPTLAINDRQHFIQVELETKLTNLINKPQNDAFYIQKLNKLKDTVYYFDKLVIDSDQKAFISLKDLNQLRRMAIDKITTTRLNNIKKEAKLLDLPPKSFIKDSPSFEAIVHTKDQYEVCKSFGINTIYTDFLSKQVNLSRLAKASSPNALVHNLGQLNVDVSASPYFNIVNSYAINLLKNLNVKKIYLSPEITEAEIKLLNLPRISANVGLNIYGKTDVMISKHCIIAKAKKYTNKSCGECLGNKYSLKDEYENDYQIFTEPSDGCNNRIIDYKKVDLIPKIDDLIKLGVNLFLLTFTDEKKDEVIKVLSKIKR